MSIQLEMWLIPEISNRKCKVSLHIIPCRIGFSLFLSLKEGIDRFGITILTVITLSNLVCHLPIKMKPNPDLGKSFKPSTKLWDTIWKLNVPNKVRNFWWRECRNSLTSKENLFRSRCAPCRLPTSVQFVTLKVKSIEANFARLEFY